MRTLYNNLLVDADLDEVYSVNNKTVTPPDGAYTDVVVNGDNMSNSLIFKLNRVIDGVDIADKTFQVYYVNADGYGDTVSADAVNVSDDFVLFSWRIDRNVTAAVGEVSFIIKIVGDNYIWKSKPSSITVVQTLNETESMPEYDGTWLSGIEDRLSAAEAALAALTARVETLENA